MCPSSFRVPPSITNCQITRNRPTTPSTREWHVSVDWKTHNSWIGRLGDKGVTDLEKEVAYGRWTKEDIDIEGKCHDDSADSSRAFGFRKHKAERDETRINHSISATHPTTYDFVSKTEKRRSCPAYFRPVAPFISDEFAATGCQGVEINKQDRTSATIALRPPTVIMSKRLEFGRCSGS